MASSAPLTVAASAPPGAGRDAATPEVNVMLPGAEIRGAAC
jgi:hypothetical protein